MTTCLVDAHPNVSQQQLDDLAMARQACGVQRRDAIRARLVDVDAFVPQQQWSKWLEK